jgi:hypothetical protein
MVTACHCRNRIEWSAVSTRTTKDMHRGTRDTKLSGGGASRSATMSLMRRGDAKLSNSGQAQTTEEEGVAETSRLWAEFRLAVVGHLVVGDVERGQLGTELKSLSAKKWKHPITGARVTFGYSTIERWYYVVLNNPKARLRAMVLGVRAWRSATWHKYLPVDGYCSIERWARRCRSALPNCAELISEAGAAAVFRLPTDFPKVAPTIRQYLRQ